ncbi:MAG: riboflavin kinase [Elusimicrobia bacterium]|nr:riboflavin kinase [Elusimicrobiota bacterium]
MIVLAGEVVRGAGLGRRLGFPTANVAVGSLPLPAFGVYRAQALWDGAAPRPAVCNIGVRPTLGRGAAPWIEVHVLGFDGDLYGKRLEVRCLDKIRDEKKFSSLEELAEQIRRDCAAAS